MFLVDLARGTANQVTFSGHDGSPIWTPDGQHMVWSRVTSTGVEVVTRSVLGGDSVRVLKKSTLPLMVSGVLGDGSAALYSEYGSVDADVWEVPINGGPARPLVQEPLSQLRGIPSPDGRWIAYMTDESGSREICVRPIGRTGGRTQISPNGGNSPMWAPDSRTLYFESGNGLVAASVVVREGALVADSAHYLFDLPQINSDGSIQTIDIDPSGKRFLVRIPVGETNELREISIRLNWASALLADPSRHD